MRTAERAVVDTNVLVSGLLRWSSIPGQTLAKVLDSGILLVSDATMSELADVLARPRLDPFVSSDDRKQFLLEVGCTAEFVPIVQLVGECRDPNDDKFLEVALNGRADVIVTGDRDLLAMHPWRGVKIFSPGDFLNA